MFNNIFKDKMHFNLYNTSGEHGPIFCSELKKLLTSHNWSIKLFFFLNNVSYILLFFFSIFIYEHLCIFLKINITKKTEWTPFLYWMAFLFKIKEYLYLVGWNIKWQYDVKTIIWLDVEWSPSSFMWTTW